MTFQWKHRCKQTNQVYIWIIHISTHRIRTKRNHLYLLLTTSILLGKHHYSSCQLLKSLCFLLLNTLWLLVDWYLLFDFNEITFIYRHIRRSCWMRRREWTFVLFILLFAILINRCRSSKELEHCIRF